VYPERARRIVTLVSNICAQGLTPLWFVHGALYIARTDFVDEGFRVQREGQRFRWPVPRADAVQRVDPAVAVVGAELGAPSPVPDPGAPLAKPNRLGGPLLRQAAVVVVVVVLVVVILFISVDVTNHAPVRELAAPALRAGKERVHEEHAVSAVFFVFQEADGRGYAVAAAVAGEKNGDRRQTGAKKVQNGCCSRMYGQARKRDFCILKKENRPRVSIRSRKGKVPQKGKECSSVNRARACLLALTVGPPRRRPPGEGEGVAQQNHEVPAGLPVVGGRRHPVRQVLRRDQKTACLD